MKNYLAVATLGLVGLSIAVPTFAGQTTNFKMIGNRFANVKQVQGENYSKELNQEVAKGDYTVRLVDMGINQETQTLDIVVEVDSEKEIASIYQGDFDIFQNIYLNGKELNTGATGNYEQVDKDTVRISLSHDLDQVYTGKVDVDYNIKQIRDQDEMHLNQWFFQVELDASK